MNAADAGMAVPPAGFVARCQTILAHAWMVRTFVKHSPEVEDFPELMQIARTVFDMSRALETRVDDPAGYRHLLAKKIGKLRKAAEQFRKDAPVASSHTNFEQAARSIDGCVAALDEALRNWPAAAETSANSTTAGKTGPADLPPADQGDGLEAGSQAECAGRDGESVGMTPMGRAEGSGVAGGNLSE